MKCFLHVGTEKTATTTIQDFLNINRKRLLEQGMIYTKSAGESNNRALACAAFNPSKRDDFTRSLQLKTDAELKDFQQKTILSLKKEIEAMSSNSDRLIFSSEHFQSRLTDLEEIERLKAIMVELGATEVIVVIYLRRPADLATSLFSTALKSGNIFDEPPHPRNGYWNNICNHKATLEKFGSVFGKSKLIPRLFKRTEFVNGSIIDDITNIFGMPDINGFVLPENKNESLSMLGVSLLKRLNKSVPQWVDDRTNPARSNLVSYIEQNFTDEKYVMPAHLYVQYEEEFRDSNEWVRQEFFPEKSTLFSDDIPEQGSAYMQENAIENISDLIADIWNAKQNEIIALKNRIGQSDI